MRKKFPNQIIPFLVIISFDASLFSSLSSLSLPLSSKVSLSLTPDPILSPTLSFPLVCGAVRSVR